jgi:hypothetical protein
MIISHAVVVMRRHVSLEKESPISGKADEICRDGNEGMEG